MHFQTVIESVDSVLSVAFLVASVIPILVMPYRIVQAFVDKAPKDCRIGEHTYNPIFAWLIYSIVVIGVVFPFYQLGVLDSDRALKAGVMCACLLGVLLLCCYLLVLMYKMTSGKDEQGGTP